MNTVKVSTHSRAEAAAKASFKPMASAKVSTHSRAEAAAASSRACSSAAWFQHTAARRRLQNLEDDSRMFLVFQHTAARRRLQKERYLAINIKKFQHTAARRRLLVLIRIFIMEL